LRKLRTIRHPDILKFIDVVETDTSISIMTERVRPLGPALQEWASKPAKAQEEWIIWGLHRISVRFSPHRRIATEDGIQVALAFINDSCTSTHGNINVNSIFISPSGEWRLGGFEVLSTPKEENAVLYVCNVHLRLERPDHTLE
jgi:SCY1-like protein 1